MQVRTSPIIPTRPCRHCLSLQNDSVFADFDADENGQLYLLRISFDGYGCCYPEWSSAPVKMSVAVSRRLLHLVEAEDPGHPDVGSILSSYFVECGGAVWTDALREHDLI